VDCIVGCAGGVLAQLGTTPSTLLLPEQAASSDARTDSAATTRIVMRVPQLAARANADKLGQAWEEAVTLRLQTSALNVQLKGQATLLSPVAR
jgi:hypothetical protein